MFLIYVFNDSNVIFLSYLFDVTNLPHLVYVLQQHDVIPIFIKLEHDAILSYD